MGNPRYFSWFAQGNSELPIVSGRSYLRLRMNSTAVFLEAITHTPGILGTSSEGREQERDQATALRNTIKRLSEEKEFSTHARNVLSRRKIAIKSY